MNQKTCPVHEIIVIGSGIGGLTAAALLAKSGYNVLILEKNHLPGGCCSTYPRYGFKFESGATTLMGFDEFQPLQRLEKEAGLKLDKIHLKIPMSVWLDGEQIIRYEDLNDWIAEAEKHFGKENQRNFWEFCYNISRDAWELSHSMPYYPPANFKDWMKFINPVNIRFLKSLPWVFKSTCDVLEKFGLTKNKKFMRFIDQQMLIASQAYSHETQFLVGAPVLTYTNSPNYYLTGGLIQLPDRLIGMIREYGGSISYRKEVAEITWINDGYQMLCTDGTSYHAKKVISNSSIWNMAEMISGKTTNYFKTVSDRFKFSWGAFIVNLGIKDRFSALDILHHQVIFSEPLPYLNSTSVFVSANHSSDSEKAEPGYRSINISTHDPNPEIWFSLPSEEYQKRKSEIESAIRERIRPLLDLTDDDIKIRYSGTARSFNEWIGRKHGRVGGIPSSGLKTIFRMAGSRTPMKNLYMVGDTVFPGQGIPAVAQSGINTFFRILDDDR